MPEPVLRCERLGYSYPNARGRALVGIDISVHPGEFVLLCGPSGSGKSTLLRAACGLVPHFHGGRVEGSLQVTGLAVEDHGPAELAARVGMLAQEPESQVVSTTVRAEIELPLELRGASASETARGVEEVALALGIDHLVERTTDTLSGGELQRVALAAALVTSPALLLLDEPTSQLDPVTGDELLSLLRRLNEEWGTAIVLAEHRIERCLPAVDRVVAMRGGAVTFDGAPGDFLGWAVAEEASLATPAARLFAAAGLRPARGVREGRRLLEERGVRPEPRSGAAGDPGAGGGLEPGRPRGIARARAALRRHGDRGGAVPGVLRLDRVWVELGEGEGRIEALRGIDLLLEPGERVALMGRNGAGKTTLLRTAAGLVAPARGSVTAPHGVALVPQRPDDLIVRERVGDELPGEGGAAALERFGLAGLDDADPRDLSGGERQRLALAIVAAGRGAGGGAPPGAVLLDEPTRGMDRALKRELADLVRELAGAGAGVAVATHDVEFAAVFASRVLLMGGGELVADGPADELLAGGWYFSTEVARLLGGAAITPEAGGPVLAGMLGRPDNPGGEADRATAPAGEERR